MRVSNKPARSVSLLSLTFMVSVLAVIIQWNGGQQTVSTVPEGSLRWRHLEEFGKIELGGGLEENGEPTTTCRHYLQQYLNGTTDSYDECQAFRKAYNAEDCKNRTSFDLGVLSNSTDDGPTTIDDWIERWDCCDAIHTLYEGGCETTGEYHSVRLLGIVLVLLVCTMIKALLKRMGVTWLPDACAFIMVGFVVGGTLRLFDSGFVGKKLSFDNELFLQIMLPPIIFQAALSIDKRAFRRDLFPILSFAGVGTAFSAIAIGWMVHKVSQWGSSGSLPLLDSLVFGSLIASIDPVATLSILAGVGVSQTDTLYTLIFGESLLNDGVAIVLFDTLRSHLGEDGSLTESDYHEMALHFCAVLCGSIGIGLGVGFFCTIYFWALRGQQTAVTEVAIFFCWALIPYYIAEAVDYSGIISIMVMGFVMDYYVIGGFQSEEVAWMDYMAMRTEDEHGVAVQQQMDRWSQLISSLSKAFSGRGHILSRSRHHVGFVAHVIASVMETAIFAYLGLFLFNDTEWHIRLNLTAIVSCVCSRAVMVLALSLLINMAVFMDLENRIGRCCRAFRPVNLADDDDSTGSHARVYLDRKTQVILLLSGVRGAVSFALVENIPVWDSVSKQGSQYKAELKAMTSSSIVFTLFVFGILTYITVKLGSPDAAAGPIAGSSLTHRLMSEPLDSDDENQSEMNSASLEIEQPPTRPTGANPNGSYQPVGEWTE